MCVYLELEPGAKPAFPCVSTATKDGLLAVGGELSVSRLLLAYWMGIYPCYTKEEPILWWAPDPRGIIPLDALHIGKTLRKVIKRKPFEIYVNRAFESVILNCALCNRSNSSRWVTDEMISAYTRLHHLGFAHSVEAWVGSELVGGLYGVSIGGLFAGESMFYKQSNASKVVLVELVKRLRSRGFTLLDCQMITETTASMGAVEISRDEYMQRLKKSLSLNCNFV